MPLANGDPAGDSGRRREPLSALRGGRRAAGSGGLLCARSFAEVFASLPWAAMAATVVRFLVPEVPLTRWFLDEHSGGIGLPPAQFVVSTDGFALLGVPMFVLRGTLTAYPWIAAAVVAACLLASALVALLRASEVGAAASDGGEFVDTLPRLDGGAGVYR